MSSKYTQKDRDYLLKIGKRIQEIRLKKKLTQEDLAFGSELDRTYISGIECGKRNVSLINLKKIADTLKVSIRELFE